MLLIGCGLQLAGCYCVDVASRLVRKRSKGPRQWPLLEMRIINFRKYNHIIFARTVVFCKLQLNFKSQKHQIHHREVSKGEFVRNEPRWPWSLCKPSYWSLYYVNLLEVTWGQLSNIPLKDNSMYRKHYLFERDHKR